MNQGKTSSYAPAELGEIISLQYGSALPEKARRPGTVPVFGSNGQVGLHSEPLVEGPGIIVGRKGSGGSVVWSDSSFWAIDTTYYIRSRNGSCLRWLYYLLRHARLDRLNSTSGVPGLNRNDVYETIVPVPSYAEQQKIAAILTSVDELLTTTQAIIDQAHIFKHSFIKALFEASSSSWQTASIGDISQVVTGGTPSRAKHERYFKDGTIPWVKTMDLNEGYIDSTGEKITEMALQESNCKLVPAGSVLIAMYGGWVQIGRTGLLRYEATTNQAICSILPSTKILPELLLYALQYARLRWRSIGISSRKDPNITKSDVINFKIAYPKDIDEQQDIVSAVEAINQRLSAEQEKKAQLETVKMGLMQQLLTGKLPVKI